MKRLKTIWSCFERSEWMCILAVLLAFTSNIHKGNYMASTWVALFLGIFVIDSITIKKRENKIEDMRQTLELIADGPKGPALEDCAAHGLASETIAKTVTRDL